MAVAYKKELDYPLENYRKMFLDLRKGEYFGRLGKTFKTDKNFYFIDTGTGKIAQLDEHVYLVLTTLFESDNFDSLYELRMDEQKIIDALETIVQGVEQANILSAPILETMVGSMTMDLDELLSNHVIGVTLEVTQECNLRCRYCIYHPEHPGFREFGKKHMSIETAKQAVDFLKAHSSKNDNIIYEDLTCVGFYGGEPLMNFKVVKETMEYAKTVFQDRTLQFNLTTNVVLLTQEISDYLVKNKVMITLSIDGPKELHDEHRILANGKGSFDKVMIGVNNLLKSFEKFNTEPVFAINMVNPGPDIEKKYELIRDFFENCDWFHDGIEISCNGVDIGPEKMPYVLPHSQEERSYAEGMYDVLGKWNDDNSNEYTQYEKDFTKRNLDLELVKIHQRIQLQEPVTEYSLNGCCVPGQRKCFVNVDGEMFPCERVGSDLPSLGNVKKGFDVSQVKKYYVDDYINKSKDLCKKCWAINLCTLCYMNCYDESGFDVNYRHTLCLQERIMVESNLIRYCKIKENNPELLQHLDKIEVV